MPAALPSLPERLSRFYASKEAEAYRGQYADVPSYERRLRVTFVRRGSSALTTRTTSHPTWRPLCSLGEEPELIAVDTSQPACPVALWSHESDRMLPMFDALDDFLESLSTDRDAPPKGKVTAQEAALAQLDAAITAAQKLRKKKPAEALALLQPHLIEVAPRDILFSRYACTSVNALDLVASLLRELGRSEEACAVLERRAALGGESATGMEPVFEVLLHDLDRAPRVLEITARLSGARSARFTELVGLAHLRLGENDAALASFRTVLDRKSLFVEKNAIKAEAARRKRIDALVEVVRSYGARFALSVDGVIAALSA